MHITHINLCILLYREIHQVKQDGSEKKGDEGYTSGHLKMKNNYCIAIVSCGER